MMKVKADNIEIKITPELLAKAFWNFDDKKQADFFEALARECKEYYLDNKGVFGVYEYGDFQWLGVRDELKRRNSDGLEMYQALACGAFSFLNPYTYKQG